MQTDSGQFNKAAQAGQNLRTMDELASMRSPLHQMAPYAKLILTVVYILLTVSFNKYDLSGLFVMILFPVAGYAVSRVPMRLCFYKLRYVLPLVLAVGLFNPFFDRTPFLEIGRAGAFVITGGMISMVTLMLKGIFTLMASFLLAATTSVYGLAGALRQLHIPGTLTALFTLTFRYVNVLLDEVAVMTDAYHLRAPRQKGIERKAWGSFLGQLILRSMDRANALYDSMLLRGFNGEFHYSDEGSGGRRAKDIPILGILLALMALARVVDLPVLIGELVT